MTPSSGSNESLPNQGPSRGGPSTNEFDLKQEGNKISVRARPGKEIDLKDVISLREIELRNDHQLRLIKTITASAVSIIGTISLCVTLYLLSPADRAGLIKDVLPWLLGAAGGAGVSEYRRRKR